MFVLGCVWKEGIVRKVIRLFVILDLLLDIAFLSISGKKSKIDDAIFNKFTQLGGVYIKFLQAVALKPSFMSEKDVKQKLMVFDNVALEHFNLTSFLTQRYNSVELHNFADVELEPFAAGSFAQVYRAKYKGQDVVLKVLRPDVKYFIRFDQRMIKLFGIFAGLIPSLNEIGIKQIIKQFIQTTTEEVNYAVEVSHARQLYDRYKDHQKIVIPYTFTEVCIQDCIVQERLEGVAFTELLEHRSEYTVSQPFIETMIELGYENLSSSLHNKSVHADPHPGNLLLLSDGKIGIIDFGIAAAPPRDTQAFFEVVRCYDQHFKGNFNFSTFFVAIFRFYAPSLYKSICSIDDAQTGEKYLEKLTNYAESQYAKRKLDADVQFYLQEARVRELFMKVINENNSLELDIQLDASVMQAGAASFNRMLDSFGIKHQVLAGLYARAVEDVEQHGLPRTQQQAVVDLEYIAETVDTWLHRLAQTNPLLFTKLRSIA